MSSTLFSHIFSKYPVFKGFSFVTLLAHFAFFFCYQNCSHFILAASQKYVLTEPRIAAPHKVSVLKSSLALSISFSLPGLMSAHYSPLSTLSAPLSSIVPCLEQDGTHSPMWETFGVNLKKAEMFPQMLSCRQRLLVWIICVLDSLQAALWSETINRKQHSGHMQKNLNETFTKVKHEPSRPF